MIVVAARVKGVLAGWQWCPLVVPLSLSFFFSCVPPSPPTPTTNPKPSQYNHTNIHN